MEVEMYFNFNCGDILFNNVNMWRHDPGDRLNLIRKVKIRALKMAVSLQQRLKRVEASTWDIAAKKSFKMLIYTKPKK